MNIVTHQLSSSRHHGYVKLATVTLLFVMAASAILIRFGTCDNIVRRYDRMDAMLEIKNISRVLLDKPKVGVVKGVVYSPPSSCAVIDEKMVHVGETIHNVVVVEIQSDAVEFSKDGVTWQQEVLENPNKAWICSSRADCPAG